MWYAIQLITYTNAKKRETIQSTFLDMCNNRFFPGSNDYTSCNATLYYCLIYALCIREDINLTQFFICVLEGDSKSSIDIIGLRVPTRKLRDFPSFQVCLFFKFLQATRVSLRATTRTDGPLLSCLRVARTGVVRNTSFSDRKAVSISDEHSNVCFSSVCLISGCTIWTKPSMNIL